MLFREAGVAQACRRMASACPPTLPGSARTILPRAAPTGSSESAGAWLPSSTAMTSPRASVALNMSGGSRTPRPTR